MLNKVTHHWEIGKEGSSISRDFRSIKIRDEALLRGSYALKTVNEDSQRVIVDGLQTSEHPRGTFGYEINVSP